MEQVCIIAALVLSFAFPAFAQLQSGTIYGTVTDDQGGVLPGVEVTLTGSDSTRSFTTEADGRFRFLNLPPGAYTLRTSLQGFSTMIREGIAVTVGSNVDIPVSLRVAAVEESITVSGQSPIVDTKATGTSTNFTQDELSKIPTSRDPWALLRTVPGVQMDRVNIAGNETGQQSNFASKGSSRYDSVWTLDGVVVTDMSATGGSPTYFDFDAFEEIQISTSGQDIKQPTGGAANFVVKRGTNQYKGNVRGYFTNDSLEASNVPDELEALGITPETADHNKQISEYGFDLGGPIVRDKAWVWGSWTKQDIRLNRAAGNLIDRTILKTSNIKGNWQATSKDMVSVLWFLGAKEKFGRGTGVAQVEAPSATWNQGNFYPEGRPHGLLKFQDDRVMTSNLFLSGKYAYYGTGFTLAPAGGLEGQASISALRGQSFGTTRAQEFLRPQHIINLDANHFRNFLGGSHDIKFGFGYRRHDATSRVIWPGDQVVAFENSAADTRARLYREGQSTNRNEYVSLYLGDTYSKDRLTLDAGVRFDRQSGAALPSSTASNGAFANLVPGIDFPGYELPFTWNDVHPRVGLTYALDEGRKTLLRANFSRYAAQLDANIVGFANPSAGAGYVEYPWEDRNGDLFVQPGEVRTDLPFLAPGGGFNPADPTSVASADSLDPNLKAPTTTGVIIGMDRELMPNLALQVNYSWSRTDNWVGQTGAADPYGLAFVPWRGLTIADYAPGPLVTGTLPDGSTYSIPTFIPNAARIAANGNGRQITNYDGFHTTYSGLEVSMVKRLADRWMMRAAFAYNNPLEHYDEPARNALGNPTPFESQSLNDGGALAPRSAGSGAGDVFVNGKWQLNVNGMYQLPYDIDVAGNLFGRQGNPFPIYRQVALGLDGSNRVLVTPEIDTFRFEDIWNLDLRVAKNLHYQRFNAQLVADLFNVMNNNVALNRQRNIGSTTFNRITQNLSPRILRFGVRIGF